MLRQIDVYKRQGKAYTFYVNYLPGLENDNYGAYTVELKKKSDFTMPEAPTAFGSGSGGYLWNGSTWTEYKTYYADISYKSTLYYVAKDTTFDVTFDVLAPWMPDIDIYPVSYTHLDVYKRQPEWPKGSDCKSDVDDFDGSNPSLPIRLSLDAIRVRTFFVCIF